MKVKDAIEQLKELDPNEQIIIAWWEKDVFDVNKKNWNKIVEDIDIECEWSNTHEDLQDYISIWQANYKQTKTNTK